MLMDMRRKRENDIVVSQVARLTGISRSYASRVLRGVQTPSLWVAQKMAAAMGITVDGLVARITAAREERVANDAE